MFNVIDQYNSFVENNFIKKNKDQIEFLRQADNVWSSFSKTKLFFKDKIFEGIYPVSYTHLTLPTKVEV